MSNDFLSFAGDPAANVMAQSDYAGSSFLPTLLLGFQTGVAPSAQLNKVWRQSSLISSTIGAFINAHGMNAIDDGSPGGMTNLLNNFTAALGQVVKTTFPDAPSDGSFYGRQNMTWQHVPAEAPSDGNTYARHNGAWTSISASSGIPDAPSDGNIYGRLNATWSVVTGTGGGITQGQADLRYLQLSGGTLTGTTGLLLSGVAATNRHIMAETGTTWRWELRLANADPESTNNAGSNLAILRYSDGGALIDQPITINRATGVLDFLHPPTLGGQPIPGLTPTQPPISITTPGASVFNDPGYGTFICVSMYGAGGGGGSGGWATPGTGAGGGAHNVATFRRADLTFPITLTVGAGGAGGAQINSSWPSQINGNDGSIGGATTFGSYLFAGGGGNGLGGGGGGGTAAQQPGGGGGGSMSSGGSPLIAGNSTAGEPWGVTNPISNPQHASNVGFGGGNGVAGQLGSGSVAGCSEWGGAAGANNNISFKVGNATPGLNGGASIWGGAGGGSGGGYDANNALGEPGGAGGATNAYSSLQGGSVGVPGGPAGGAANTNAGAGTAAHGNWSYGGQGGPGGAGTYQPAGFVGTAIAFPGGPGGNCGGGGGGGGMSINEHISGPGTGLVQYGAGGRGGDGAIFITII